VKIPEPFARNIEGAFGERGVLFLHALPKLIDEAAGRWQLKNLQPAEQLSYNYLVYARRDRAEVVLKLGVPDRELTSEIHALRHYAGRGAVKLLDSDSGRGMLLLERLQPGTPLSTSVEDAEATQIAAEVMLELLRPAPHDGDLIRLADWFQGLKRFRAQHNGGSGPLDPALFKQAEEVAAEIMQEEYRPTLLHGDLHHSNILSSGGRWAAIDPKGVVGPAAYEVGPLLMNPPGKLSRRADASEIMERRIAILAEVLGIERNRIRRYGIAHTVLSAVWSVEEGEDWKPAMECAKVLAGLTT
jgi:streptomycin 6-kinase